MMIRYTAITLTLLMATTAYATANEEQARYQLEQQFALADAEAQAHASRRFLMGDEVITEKTAIVDEGGNLKIIDKANPPSQPVNPTTEPRPSDTMPKTPANPNQNPMTTQPYTGPNASGAPVPDVPPPPKGKGSLQSSTPPDLYPGQSLSPEAEARGVAPQPQQPAPADNPYAAPVPSTQGMPSNGQNSPAMPSMPAPQNDGQAVPSQPMQPIPGSPNQNSMPPATPPSMPTPQGDQIPSMPSTPPVSDQLR